MNQPFFEYKTKYINFYEWEALKGAKKTLANGYVLTTEDHQLQSFFDEWTEQENFLEYMFIVEKLLRKHGRAVMTLLYSAEQLNVNLNVGIPWMLNDVSSTNFMGGVNSNQATIWLKLHSDVYANFTRAIITPKKTELQFYKDDIYTLEGGLNNDALPTQARTPKISHYNLPFVPVVDCINIPWYNAFATSLYNAYPDWRAVEGIIPLLNELIDMFLKEIFANQTRVFFNGTEGDQNVMKAIHETYKQKHPTQFKKDYARNKDEIQHFTNYIEDVKALMARNFLINVPTKGLETPNKLIEVLQANPIFESYGKAIDYWMQLFMNGCGLNHDTKDSSVNTATETMINQNDESVDLSFRRRLRNKQYTNLLMKLCIMSTDPRVSKFKAYSDFLDEKNQRIFNFQINDEKTKLTLEERQMLLTEYQNGLISLEDYIQRTQGVTKAEAKSKAEVLKKEHEDDVKDDLIETDNQALENDKQQTEKDRKDEE